MNWQETANQREGWQEQATDDERGNWRQTDYSQLDEWRGSNAEPLDRNWQDNSANEWSRETPGNVPGEQGHPHDSRELWQEDSTREAVENWTEGPAGPLRTHRPVTTRRFNRFHPPDDDNVYSMELRELLSR